MNKLGIDLDKCTVLYRAVKKFGNSGHILVSKDFIDKEVIVIIK